MALSTFGQLTAHIFIETLAPKAGVRPTEVCLCDCNKVEYRDMALTIGLPRWSTKQTKAMAYLAFYLKGNHVCACMLLINLARRSKASKEWLHGLRMLKIHCLRVILSLEITTALVASGGWDREQITLQNGNFQFLKHWSARFSKYKLPLGPLHKTDSYLTCWQKIKPKSSTAGRSPDDTTFLEK